MTSGDDGGCLPCRGDDATSDPDAALAVAVAGCFQQAADEARTALEAAALDPLAAAYRDPFAPLATLLAQLGRVSREPWLPPVRARHFLERVTFGLLDGAPALPVRQDVVAPADADPEREAADVRGALIAQHDCLHAALDVAHAFEAVFVSGSALEDYGDDVLDPLHAVGDFALRWHRAPFAPHLALQARLVLGAWCDELVELAGAAPSAAGVVFAPAVPAGGLPPVERRQRRLDECWARENPGSSATRGAKSTRRATSTSRSPNDVAAAFAPDPPIPTGVQELLDIAPYIDADHVADTLRRFGLKDARDSICHEVNEVHGLVRDISFACEDRRYVWTVLRDAKFDRNRARDRLFAEARQRAIGPPPPLPMQDT